MIINYERNVTENDQFFVFFKILTNLDEEQKYNMKKCG